MKISDLSALLTRVQQIAGDVDVVLKAAEGEAETVISNLGINLKPDASGPAGSLVIEHGEASAPPEADPAASPEPAADAAS